MNGKTTKCSSCLNCEKTNLQLHLEGKWKPQSIMRNFGLSRQLCQLRDRIFTPFFDNYF